MSKTVDMTLIAKGISEAMTTTFLGLVVAVVSLAASHFFGGIADRSITVIESRLNEFKLALFQKKTVRDHEMKLSRKQAGTPEFNMLALLDIIFIVVIFCIIGMTRMVFLEMVDVNNPELRISRQVKEKDFVTITVTKRRQTVSQ